MEIIKLTNVNKTYDVSKDVKVEALKDINLTFEAGTITTIYGVSGSGKSTLLNLIGCLDKPSSGTVVIDGQEIAPMKDKELSAFRNKYIGFVFQEFNLIPYRTAYDNIMVPLYFSKTNVKNKIKNIDSVLDSLGILNLKNRKVSDMSGGQRQRVAISRAIINENPIIIADEPTGQLDSNQREEIGKIFINLKSQGKTIIIATHDDGLAQIADRIIRLSDGNII